MSVVLKPIITGIISLVACLVITPLIIKLAYHKGWVVYPRNDRWHKKPTALMGGIGIFIAFSAALLGMEFGEMHWALYGAASVMFFVGLVDDIWEIKPVIKLLSQIACSFILIYNGFIFGGGLLGWAGIPLTFIWVIGITNAVNLLDNMDGLAAGISGIVALIAGILGILNGEYVLASMAFAVTGATFGFLFYNFKPARIFMGDSGSLFLGFSLSFLSVAVQGKLGSSSAILVLLIPISLMAIPIMDTTLVTIKRLAAGRRVDQGGRDHTSHRLVALGLSEKKAVLTLYCISGIWGLLCVLICKTQINNLFLCILMLAVFSVIFSVVLSKVKVYNESEEKLSYLRMRGQKSGNNLMLRFFLFHKKLIIGVCTDILIIYSAFLVATKAMHITGSESDYIVLATFICIKISLFYITNLYYRMWRYMEVLEAAGYFITIVISTVALSVILFVKGKTEYSFYFFLIDFLLTYIGVMFTRLFYRWLSDVINRNRQGEKKVLIYGAGDSGYLLIKELLQNHRHKLRPVGWIDDDEAKHNMYLHGYKIYGGKESLQAICQKVKPDMVLISSKLIDHDHELLIKKILDSLNIGLGRFSLTLTYTTSPGIDLSDNVTLELPIDKFDV
ncbi:hypothetical protein RG47T_3924 [Mucilaginibacter polytrichastri]|uniref:Glycosyl transferase family 4 n=2 Tax=Mucilaginibacter polytrichastri TaxID=1302689 RepID=A0A1Q6A368_9SPHI|nr:hypothetical protein RG47T_3924 [Mucilaginibacter polytrichastri]